MFCSDLSNIISELQIIDKTGPVLAVINVFQGHPSIKNVRANNLKSMFSLTCMNEREIEKNMTNMNVHKTFLSIKDIPTMIIKMNAEYFCQFHV